MLWLSTMHTILILFKPSYDNGDDGRNVNGIEKDRYILLLLQIVNFELQRGNLRARPLLLSAEEGVEGHVGDLADLESDSGNISDGVTLTTESRDQNLTSYQVCKCE